MRQRRSKFDWSILDRSGLIDYFWSLFPEIEVLDLTVPQLHRTISNHIKNLLPIKVAKTTSLEVDLDLIFIGGAYYSLLDKQKSNCIELTFVYNPDQNTINLTKRKYKKMCILMADSILHEIMHMRQYRRRKFKQLPDYASMAEKTEQRKEQSYLGNSDEIDAYSFNIACELMSKFKNDVKQITDYLNQNQRKSRRYNNCWRMYLKAFDHDHDHPIIKRTKKKIIKYLPKALEGKPYRNRDWIYY